MFMRACSLQTAQLWLRTRASLDGRGEHATVRCLHTVKCEALPKTSVLLCDAKLPATSVISACFWRDLLDLLGIQCANDERPSHQTGSFGPCTI